MARKLSQSDILQWAEDQDYPKLNEILPLVPYGDLLPAQRKMLAAMSVPAIACQSLTKQSEYATITRKTWYKHVRDPKFQKVCKAFFKEFLKDKLSLLVHRYVKLALNGDRQALERLLEQAGILDALKSTNGEQPKGDTTVYNFNFGDLSDDERNDIRDNVRHAFRF